MIGQGMFVMISPEMIPGIMSFEPFHQLRFKTIPRGFPGKIPATDIGKSRQPRRYVAHVKLPFAFRHVLQAGSLVFAIKRKKLGQIWGHIKAKILYLLITKKVLLESDVSRERLFIPYSFAIGCGFLLTLLLFQGG